ncbi:DUF2993 domain-containing protein [Streptomyces sp. JV176]|uniref:LmeA family phospholipid-binding protein n=1 Tax=Streptomyces sp. JV176 TaxID=858630 RepID=UPI002E79D76C|nr:DUF2993 domain-containing protein [Streptomyces sp. JV176]MEE1800349.1 DUF2993 domain-containing protein [Streptomyces sp. JV176]
MRPPTRIPEHLSAPEPGADPAPTPPTAPGPHPAPYPNPYDELAQLATPEDEFVHAPRDPRTLGLTSDRDDEDWTPPDHRKRGKSGRRGSWGRRFGSLSSALKLSVTLVACTAFLLLADRAALLYAQDKAEEKLQESLGLATPPAVDIHGFPFLTQVLGKRLDRVDVTVPHVAADRVSLAEVRASANDIRVVGDLPTAVKGAVVSRMDGDVLLSFDDLNRELGASQVKFTDNGAGSVRMAGSLPVAGYDLRVRADAHIRNEGGKAVSTTVDGMRLDIPGVATYRPGKDRAHSGLRLAPEAAALIAKEKNRARELLEVPAVVKALGVPQTDVDRALRSEEALSRFTGRPRFVQELLRLNLVDVVAENPGLLKRAGIDPALVDALLNLRPPELSDRLSLSFKLPKTPGDVRLQHITVEPEGIRARLVGSAVRLGGAT